MIQIYTGDSKGKTTAAMGLALRAIGAGKKVFIFEFMKSWKSYEIEILKNLGVNVDREWNGEFIIKEPSKEQIFMVRDQYKKVFEVYKRNFDLLILDEIVVTLHFGLLKEDDILKLMSKKPKEFELVLTGRGATQKMIQKADLVTEMKKIKHYFDRGIKAREGIEF